MSSGYTVSMGTRPGLNMERTKRVSGAGRTPGHTLHATRQPLRAREDPCAKARCKVLGCCWAKGVLTLGKCIPAKLRGCCVVNRRGEKLLIDNSSNNSVMKQEYATEHVLVAFIFHVQDKQIHITGISMAASPQQVARRPRTGMQTFARKSTRHPPVVHDVVPRTFTRQVLLFLLVHLAYVRAYLLDHPGWRSRGHLLSTINRDAATAIPPPYHVISLGLKIGSGACFGAVSQCVIATHCEGVAGVLMLNVAYSTPNTKAEALLPLRDPLRASSFHPTRCDATLCLAQLLCPNTAANGHHPYLIRDSCWSNHDGRWQMHATGIQYTPNDLRVVTPDIDHAYDELMGSQK
ncbi:hypothetical protein BD779DRAFT_1477414 [Infundibulicybe gibba]|nr:hypothetical protein BD779DRAFT_1477414 [Infundibulicybe gibba]